MTKIHRSAVYVLDNIIRNVRDDIEKIAKSFAKERGEEEATAEDITDAAIVMFESDHKHLLENKK